MKTPRAPREAFKKAPRSPRGDGRRLRGALVKIMKASRRVADSLNNDKPPGLAFNLFLFHVQENHEIIQTKVGFATWMVD